jgi:hypothetical protein
MKRRIVFAGDSIVHGGPWQYWLPEHYVTNFAFPGHTTSDMDVLVDDIVESQPELLIVMIGTNDFGKHRYSEEKVIQNILNVAKKLKANLAQIPVIWHSLTPRKQRFLHHSRQPLRQLSYRRLGCGPYSSPVLTPHRSQHEPRTHQHTAIVPTH